jgi:integrase
VSAADLDDYRVADTLAFVDATADAVLEAGVRDNTRRAFEQDWQHWTDYMAGLGVPLETVRASLLVEFVTWLAHGTEQHAPQSPATIERRLTGVLAGWHARGLDVPRGITTDARTALKNLIHALAEADEERGRGSAPAVTIPQLRRICAELPPTATGHRDRAIILLGFAIAARRSELAQLLTSNVVDDPEGLVVRVRSGKTPRIVAVRPGTVSGTCPVTAWHRWRELVGAGPAFVAINRHGTLGAAMSPAAVGAVVTRRGDAVGVYGLTGHSLRSGLATEARRAGHDRKTIAAQTGHSARSAVLDGYMQIVDRWADNALTGIGL